MKRAIVAAAVALMIPGVALAGGNPGHGGKGDTNGHGNKAAPKVMYVLKGTLSAYAAANGSTNGSITIDVKQANGHSKALKGQKLTFPVASTTKISLETGVTTIADGDKGIVKVKAAKKIAAADLATTLQAAAAQQIVDQGTSGN